MRLLGGFECDLPYLRQFFIQAAEILTAGTYRDPNNDRPTSSYRQIVSRIIFYLCFLAGTLFGCISALHMAMTS